MMIYFDNSASTPLCPAAKDALTEAVGIFANPSSLHRLGFEAERRMEEAREAVAKSLFAAPEEITFTSGGTEADNLAIFGAAHKNRHAGRAVVSTDSEHPAAEECLRELEREGFEVRRLKTRGGRIDRSDADAAFADGAVSFVAVMHTNNETGAVYDLAALSRLAKAKNPRCLVFSDAVQGYLKSEIRPARLGVDLLAVSAHKIHGPKGVGALWMRRGLSLPPRVFGGGQERGLRSGTENLPGILAFGAAAKEGFARLEEGRRRMASVREAILASLADEKRVRFHLPETPSCHVLSLSVAGFRSEVLLHTLSEKDVFVSSGSACSSHKGKSPVLKNFGLSDAEADATIRLSFSRFNTVAEAEEFVRHIKELIV